MKLTLLAGCAAMSYVSAHSWLGCTNQDNTQLKQWMVGNSTLSPQVIIDPSMPWYSYLCQGWPRNKNNPGDWIEESTSYSWNLVANKFTGDTNACHPSQRSAIQKPNAPMASAVPGGTIRLYYGGNGHARGYNAPSPTGGDPGLVSVYWKGKPETEITDQKEFTKDNLLQSQGFSADSFSYPANPDIKRPQDGLVDKGNWMEVKLPSNIAAGRHMMVWVWSYAGAPQWSTCFDVSVSGQADYKSTSIKGLDVSTADVAAPAAANAQALVPALAQDSSPAPAINSASVIAVPAAASPAAAPPAAAPFAAPAAVPSPAAAPAAANPAVNYGQQNGGYQGIPSAAAVNAPSSVPEGQRQRPACPSRYNRSPMANYGPQ